MRPNARDVCITPGSSKRRPTICIPTGSPALVKPHGTVAAGFQLMFNGCENSAHWIQSHGSSGQCAGISRSAGIAGADTVGVMRKSQPRINVK